MIKRKALLLLLLLVYWGHSHAQNATADPNPDKGSGPGGSIVSVDNYTGVGSVNVPIYNYKIDGLDLGVSLSYSTKGIRVDELASSVGLGWQLNAAGQISRQVFGIEDEVTLPSMCAFDLYNTHNYRGLLVPGAGENGIVDDTERDVFTANLGGKVVTFHLKNDSVYITHPTDGIKIDIITKDYVLVAPNMVYTNFQKGIKLGSAITENDKIVTFNITDEKGNKFYFERGDYYYEKEYKLPSGIANPTTGVYFPTANWVISKIETYTGQIIKYTYQGNFVEYIQSVSESFNSNDYVSTSNKFKGYKLHVKKIEYPSGTTVTFNLDYSTTGGRCDCSGDIRLKDIVIEDRYDNLVSNKMTYSLDQAYFNTPALGLSNTEYSIPGTCGILRAQISVSGTGADSIKDAHMSRGLRLKLKGITRKGTDNSSTEAYYSFDYNNTPLPYRFSPKVDYYGFYNGGTLYPIDSEHLLSYGINGAYSSLPYPYNDKSCGVDKTPNHDSMQAWSITKVKNGYGGDIEIQYIPYTLYNPDCQYAGNLSPSFAGRCDINEYGMIAQNANDGLVIGKLITTDKYNADYIATSEYNYYDGQRFYRGGYHFTVYGDAPMYSNNFTDYHDTYNGSNHGFSKVTVTSKGYNNEVLNAVDYYYSNLMYKINNVDYSNLRKETGGYSYSTRALLERLKMGQLLVMQNKDHLGYLTQVDTYSYDYVDIPATINHTNGMLESIPRNNFMTVGTNISGTYPSISQTIRHSITRNVRYITIPPHYKQMSLVYQYTYNDNLDLRSTSYTDSKGDFFIKYKYYNYDILNQYGYVEALDSMRKRNIRFLMSTELWRKNSSSDSVLLAYSLEAPNVPSYANSPLRFPASFSSFSNIPLTSSQVFPGSGSSTAVNKANALNYLTSSNYGSNLRKSLQFELYDDSNHVLQTRYNGIDDYSSYIVDAQFGSKLAEVKNAKYEDIAFTSFEGNYKAINTTDYTKGNWNFEPTDKKYYLNASCSSAMTGNYIYELKTSAQNYIQSKPLNNRTYLLSYWVNSTGAPVISLYNGTTYVGAAVCSLSNTVGSWKLYVGTVTVGTGSSIKITNNSSSTMYIDEVRLHPTDAAMTSYTYKPMFGIGTKNDATNYVNYYEYNSFGQLYLIRDMRKNILWKKERFRNDPDAVTTGTGGTGTSYNPSTVY